MFLVDLELEQFFVVELPVLHEFFLVLVVFFIMHLLLHILCVNSGYIYTQYSRTALYLVCVGMAIHREY